MKAKMLKPEHKAFLRRMGFRPTEFLLLGQDYESYTFLYRVKNKKISFRR